MTDTIAKTMVFKIEFTKAKAIKGKAMGSHNALKDPYKSTLHIQLNNLYTTDQFTPIV